MKSLSSTQGKYDHSMSNLELLLLLYDEAVKRLKMAQIALEDKNMRLLKSVSKKQDGSSGI